MKIIIFFFTLTLMALTSTSLWAATVTHSFDTVSSVNMLRDGPRSVIISGVEKDTGSPLYVTIFGRISGIDFIPELQRCIPMFLMAMDKPGRYFLHITQEDLSAGSLNGCNLEVKI